MQVKKSFLYPFVFLVLLALPIAGRYALYYERPVDRPEIVRPDLDVIDVPTPSSKSYSDESQASGKGIVIVDMAHENRFELSELDVLAARLAARGYLLKEWLDEDIDQVLEEASSLLVAVPAQSFSQEEVKAVQDFVSSGGRLLLIGDPTRFEASYNMEDFSEEIDSDVPYLNSLSVAFGIAFVDDYLYNVEENEGNFRNIRLDDWGKSEDSNKIVAGLESVVFYATHSLSVPENAAIIRADNLTWSSATDRPGGLVVAAQTKDERVVALGDLTFMTEPYHTVRDNGRFIAQIADFLMGEERSYELVDYPLFFGPETLLVFPENPELGPGQLQLVSDLQKVFEENDRSLSLAKEVDPKRNALVASLYSQSDSIEDYLFEIGITLVVTLSEVVDSQVITEEVELDEAEPAEGLLMVDTIGEFDMSGTALVVLENGKNRQVLTVLAASQQGLENVLNQLPDLESIDCVFSDSVVLCPSGVSDEEIEMSWEPVEAEPEEEQEEEPEAELLDFEGTLIYDEPVTGLLEENTEHLWKFEGQSGDRISILADTNVITMDLALQLEMLDGDVLAYADDYSSGGEEIADYELSDTDTYAVRVSDFWGEGGAYTLTLELLSSGDVQESESADTISFGETIEGELEAGQVGEWTFTGEAQQAITIILIGGDEGDMILELYGPSGSKLTTVDSGMYGEEERLEGKLASDGQYTIKINEFYGDPVSYSLSLQAGGEGGVIGGEGILVVNADDGTATLEGETSGDLIVELLSPDYDVDVWTISEDGPIYVEDMLDYQLVIWSSGDFENGDFFTLYEFLFESKPLIMCGAYPALAATEETATLRDLEISDFESELTSGMTPGEVYELATEFDAVTLDFTDDSGTFSILLRGPASDQAGEALVVGFEGDDFLDAKLLIIPVPYYLMPEEIQGLLLENAMSWFGIMPAEG
ncbi:MAG: hypothetical protein JXA42_07155 [Anaerolineales bacterium]|nr:hypothetical protein [Anaerolineales bacterium]